MANSENNPKDYQKQKAGQVVTFKSPSRFSGGGGFQKQSGKSQYKPMPIRITQHKG